MVIKFPKIPESELPARQRERHINQAIQSAVTNKVIWMFGMGVLQNAGIRESDYIALADTALFELMLTVAVMNHQDSVSHALIAFAMWEGGKVSEELICKFLEDVICAYHLNVTKFDNPKVVDWSAIPI